MDTPYDWGLPLHIKTWRKHQLEAVQWCTGVTGYGLLEAPTGSGKTGIAKALSRDYMNLAVVKTKLLQLTVYKEHGFNILMGKGNYACIHPDYKGRTAEDCPFERAIECEMEELCPYRYAMKSVMGSRSASINYSYLLVTKSMWHNREFMFLDECHLLPEITLEFVGISIGKDDILKWGLPRPPARLLVDGSLDISGLNRPETGLAWLAEVEPVIKSKAKGLANRTDIPGTDLYSQATRLSARVTRAKEQIEMNPIVWFMESNGESFYAKPLTARYHFQDLFNLHIPTVLMSGTIGDFETLAKELGIPEYQELRVPSRYGPERRPVYDLGAPKLSYKSGKEDWEEQARLIATAVKQVPSSWDGVIHTTKKQYAFELAERLARNGLQDRVWVTPLTGTDKQIAAWKEHKQKSAGYKRPGQLAIAWSWTEGVDLRDEKICITAKCLTPNMVIASPEKRCGYVTINQVKEGMMVYTLDKSLKLIETPIKDVILVNWYDGVVFQWKMRGLDVTVSAEHEMMIRRDNWWKKDNRWEKVDMVDVPEVFQIMRWNRKTKVSTTMEARHSHHIQRQEYHGSLWCVETEAGTILAGKHGVDNFLWMGNCPFGDLGAPYEKARFNFSHSFYFQRAAWDLVQSLGRTRRGEDDDYDTEDDMRGLVAIADGNYRKIEKWLPEDFRQSIVRE